MKLDPEEREYFDAHDTMPTWLVTADFGCERPIILPAANWKDGLPSTSALLEHIQMCVDAVPVTELREYLEDREFVIKNGPDMTKDEWEAMQEFDGC